MKKGALTIMAAVMGTALFMSSCAGGGETAPSGIQEEKRESSETPNSPAVSDEADMKKEERGMIMKIEDTEVIVAWEDNESVEALQELCEEKPLAVQMSMYGGFEQVGSLGTDLPNSDVQTTTGPGDIVLYSGNQLVVFYGSNTWEYTRLGRITDKSADEMTKLLSNGDVTIIITEGKAN